MDGIATLWDCAERRHCPTVRSFPASVWSLRLLLTAANFSPRVMMTKARPFGTQQLARRLARSSWMAGRARGAASYSRDGGQILVAYGDLPPKPEWGALYGARTGEKVRAFRGSQMIICSIAFAPDGQTVATGCFDNTAILWDVRTGTKILTFGSPNGDTSIVDVAFSRDGRQLVATNGRNGQAILWNVTTGERIRTLAGHAKEIVSLAFSPDGGRLLTSSNDGATSLWESRSGRELLTLAGHTSCIGPFAFSRDGSQIVTTSRDGTTRVWSAATGQELAQLLSIDAGKDWLVVTPDGVFDGSENARKKYVRFRDPKDPMKVVPPEQGFADYYHPNLLADILAGHAVAPPGWQHITIHFVPAAPAGGKPAAPANPPSPPSAAPRPTAK